MPSESSSPSLSFLAPAKVNLFLEVLGKRPDGYHELETLMVALDWCDRLEFHPDESGVLTLTCDDPDLSCGPDNLVIKAAETLRRNANCDGGARIHLEKRIPMQAGLAGGSSDAAATLKGLNQLWGMGLANEELARLGAEVGSDVAFFFSSGAAWCTGRGEKVQAIKLGRALDFVIAHPGVGLSTADVFRRVSIPAKPRSGSELRRAVEQGDVEEIGRRLHNRLQEPAEALCPQVRALREKLESAGPVGALMTGSGSAVFAVCGDRNDAMRVARTMSAEVGGPSPDELEAGHIPNGRFVVRVVRSCP